MKRLLAALVLLGIPLSAQAEDVKIVVVPFTPLGGEVPSNAGTKAADVLVTTLKSHEGLAVKLAGAGAAEDPAAHVKKAQALVVQARQALDAGQPHQARTLLEQALTEDSQGAAALDDAASLAELHAALSRACYQSGDDAKGLAELDFAEALAPGQDFAETRSSPLFATLATREQSKVWSAEKASLKLGSIPPGATARIDGLEAGRTPVTIRDLPPGAHLWRVELPAGGSVGGVIELKAGGKAEATGAASASGPAAGLIGQLASNSLQQASLASMKEAAAGLDAQWLIFGGLNVDGTDLGLDSFVYSAKDGAFARLPKARFDPDLVSAGQALATVANDVAGRANAGTLGAPVKMPAKVSEGSSSEYVEASEFRFPAPGGDQQPKKETGPRRVVGGRTKGPVKPSSGE